MCMKMKYAIEAKVDVRILWVDVDHKKCLVKAKKSIVKGDESEIVTSSDDLKFSQNQKASFRELMIEASWLHFTAQCMEK